MSESPSGEKFPRTKLRDQDYYRRIGSIGGKNVKDRYGVEYFSTIGKKGGATTKARYGTAHYRTMGKRGGATRRQTN